MLFTCFPILPNHVATGRIRVPYWTWFHMWQLLVDMCVRRGHNQLDKGRRLVGTYLIGIHANIHHCWNHTHSRCRICLPQRPSYLYLFSKTVTLCKLLCYVLHTKMLHRNTTWYHMIHIISLICTRTKYKETDYVRQWYAIRVITSWRYDE